MPFVPVANTVMVELRYILDSQRIENTLYFERPDAPTPANMAGLLGAVFNWWDTNLQPLIPLSVEFPEMVATDLSSATGPQVTQANTGPPFGGVNDPVLPNNVTIAISFRTALRGRSFRGRNYHPALWETGVIKNTVQDTIVAAIQAAYNALITDAGVLAENYVWTVVSRFSGVDGNGRPIPRAAGVTTAVTAAIIVDPTVDSMRRRLPGRGR